MAGGFAGVTHAIALLVCSGILASCSLRTETVAATSSKPQITLSAEQLDFGRLDPYERHERVIRIRNTGGSLLHLAAVISSCRCTLAAIEEYEVQPGSEVPLTVKLELSDYDSDTVKTKLFVDATDPGVEDKSIEISAEIAPEYELQAAELDWGKIKQGIAVSKSLVVRRTGKPVVRVERVEVTQPWKATLAQTTGDEYQIEVTLPEDVPRGVATGKLAIVTDVKRRPRREIPLRAEVVGLECAVSPKVLVFGPLAPGEEAGTTEITSIDSIQVTEVRCPPGLFEWNVEALDQGRRILVCFFLAKDAQPGDVSGCLQLTIREGALQECLEVPYFGTVAPSDR